METATEKGLELNKAYLSSLAGRLKQVQVVVGIVYTGIMVHLLSTHTSDMTYMLFVTCGSALIAGTFVLLVASLLEWGADGKLVMCRISFVFHRTAAVLLFFAWISLISIFLIREIIFTDRYYYSWRLKWYISIGVITIVAPINIVLYEWSARLAQKSILNY